MADEGWVHGGGDDQVPSYVCKVEDGRLLVRCAAGTQPEEAPQHAARADLPRLRGLPVEARAQLHLALTHVAAVDPAARGRAADLSGRRKASGLERSAQQ